MALPKTDHVSEATYRRLALADPQGQWELQDGQLRERPPISFAHGRTIHLLLAQLYAQLDLEKNSLRPQHARLRVSSNTYYIPDVAVIPVFLEHELEENPRELDAYPEPLPLVAEIWSPSTGNYDIDKKIPGYQRRGDLEIWRIHPYERTLTAWVRQPDGSYTETIYRAGLVRPSSFPAVAIDLALLFAA